VILNNRGRIIGLLAIVGSLLSIQGSAGFAKGLFQTIGEGGVSVLKIWLGAGLLLAMQRPWKGPALNVGATASLFIYALSIVGMTLGFYQSIATIPIGVSVAIQFLGPLGLGALHARTPTEIFFVLMAIVGVFLLEPMDSATFGMQLKMEGVLWAVLAGACWALYIVSGRKATLVLGANRTTALGLLAASLLMIPYALSLHENIQWTTELIESALVIACFACALPYALEATAMSKLSTKEFSVLMALEPLMATIIGHFALAEVLHWGQVLGIGAISVSAMGSAIAAKNPSPETAQ